MKGQIKQVFVFMMAIIVVGALVLLGYKAISTISSQSCEADLLKFKANLEKDFTSYERYGTVQHKDLFLPCDYSAICFTDVDAADVNSADVSPIIKDSVESGVDTSVFLQGSDGILPLADIDNVQVANPYALCLQGPSIKLKYEGQGQRVLVSERG